MCPAENELDQVYSETRGGPSIALGSGDLICRFAPYPRSRDHSRVVRAPPNRTAASCQLHTAATAAAIPAAVLRPNLIVLRRIGRVWRSGATHSAFDAPGERHEDKEGANPPPTMRQPPRWRQLRRHYLLDNGVRPTKRPGWRLL